MGLSRWINRWWSSSEKADTQFPEPRVRCPEERSQAKEVKDYLYASETFSHNYFCQSDQNLRSSLRFVWGIQSLPSKNGQTPADMTFWPIVRASKFDDDNTYTFDWSSRTRRFIAKLQRTNWKVITTRQIKQILYWCRILDNRDLTICRTSGMSWVHFAKRW